MEKETLDLALKSFGEEIAGNIEKKGFLTKEELGVLATEVKEFKAEQAKIVEKFEQEVSALKRNETANNPKELGLKELLNQKADDLLKLKEASSGNLQLELKFNTAGLVPIGSGIAFGLTDFERGLTNIPRAQPFISQLIPNSSTNKMNVAYTQMTAVSGGAGNTSEGAAKSVADFTLTEASQKVEKITAYIKVSKEALDDIDSLAAEINQELLTLVELRADSQLLSGTGTTPQIRGLLTSATAFSATGFTGMGAVGATTGANNFDVLIVAMNQIKTAEFLSGVAAGFNPDTIILNPTDVAQMKLRKDTTNNYVFGGEYIANFGGVRIVENARMTSGSFLVFDSSKAQIKNRSNTTISIGYENDDFTKNLITVLAEKRLCQIVKSNHAKAFVTGTFAAAKTALV